MEKQHIRRKCVRREIVKQSHFVEEKKCLYVRVLSLLVIIECSIRVCRVIYYLEWITIL